MINKTYHTVGSSNIKSKSRRNRSKIDAVTHIYMTTHFPGLIQVLLEKVTGLN